MDTIVEGVRRGHLDPTVTLTIIHNRADVVTDVGSWRGEKKKIMLGYRTIYIEPGTEIRLIQAVALINLLYENYIKRHNNPQFIYTGSRTFSTAHVCLIGSQQGTKFG